MARWRGYGRWTQQDWEVALPSLKDVRTSSKRCAGHSRASRDLLYESINPRSRLIDQQLAGLREAAVGRGGEFTPLALDAFGFNAGKRADEWAGSIPEKHASAIGSWAYRWRVKRLMDELATATAFAAAKEIVEPAFGASGLAERVIQDAVRAAATYCVLRKVRPSEMRGEIENWLKTYGQLYGVRTRSDK